MKISRTNPGFSLIELMTVLLITGLLLTLAWPSYQSHVRRGHRLEAHVVVGVEGVEVELVAPRVENGGSINVNGSAALVAADAATLTFSPTGLFDIQVDSGTSATGTVAANTGSIISSWVIGQIR